MFKVLLVEDSIRDLNGIINHIKWDELSCEVIATASDGEEGVAKAFQTKPDIIITDISMPALDGISMTRQILGELPDIQFIFMTAFDDFGFAHEAIKLNICDYVLKPVSLDLLTEAIKKACATLGRKQHSIQKEKQFNQLLSDNIATIKERFLINALTNNENPDVSFAEYMNLNLDSGYWFAVCEIYDRKDTSILQQKFSKQLRIKKLCAGHLDGFTGSICAAYGDSFVVMIIPREELDADSLVQSLTDLYNKFSCSLENIERIFLYVEPVKTNEFNETFAFVYSIITSMMFEEEKGVVLLDKNIVSISNKEALSLKIYNSIEKNYAHFDAVNYAIQDLGISLNYANILFKQKYNRTIFEHLIFTRIEAAKKMLADKNVRIYEIAEKVGYTSNTYFSTAFRQHTGLSPKEYRTSLKDEERKK